MIQGDRSADSVSDLEFIRGLRETVTRYLRSVDSWESAFQDFDQARRRHRLLTSDLQSAHAEYVRARSELEWRAPRARRLCAKFEVRDPFPGLMHVDLGTKNLQVRNSSAVGRNERAAIVECLAQLEAMCVETQNTGDWRETPAQTRKTIFRRIYDFFF